MSDLPDTPTAIELSIAAAKARAAERQITFARDKDLIIAALKPLGLAHVHAEYCGESDDGQIHTITAHKPDGGEVELVGTPPIELTEGAHSNLYLAIEDLLWQLLEEHHAGFEINDGGSGTFFIDVAADTALLTHKDHYVAYETTETEI